MSVLGGRFRTDHVCYAKCIRLGVIGKPDREVPVPRLIAENEDMVGLRIGRLIQDAESDGSTVNIVDVIWCSEVLVFGKCLHTGLTLARFHPQDLINPIHEAPISQK